METMNINRSVPNAEIHKGPSLGMVASITILIFMLNVLAYNVLTNWTSYPVPSGPPEVAQDFFLKFPNVLRISSFLQLGAAITIGIFTATITSLLRFLGVKAAGANIALFGGIAASVFLSLSGLLTWVQSQPGIASNINIMRLVQLTEFASGGVVHIAMLGLLCAGISLPSLLGGFMPRWLCWLGLVTAALSEIVTISFIFYGAFFLLPIARFATLLWLVGAGFKIAKSKVSNK